MRARTLLEAITRYTNSQNAVREKDFLALTSDFKTWARQMAERYGVYLEIQRGGWDSRRALQKQHPDLRQFTEMANAFDLLKVYGAGWLGEAGLAFGKNPPFLPNGTIFKRIINQEGVAEGEPFGVDDLYASYLLKSAADSYGFGRGATEDSADRLGFSTIWWCWTS
jgi:AIPR protein